MVVSIFTIVRFLVVLCVAYILWFGIRILRVQHASRVIQSLLATQETEGKIEELVRLARILRKDSPLIGRVCQVCAAYGAEGSDVEDLLFHFCSTNDPTCETTDIFRYFLCLLKPEVENLSD